MTMLVPTASALALSGSMAVAAGLVGAFALMRRMTLAGDALSHVALPGIGVAILIGINPLAGALVALLGGAVLIWALERRTRVATEAIIGAIEMRDVDRLKQVLKESIIYPKMIYLSRKMGAFQGSTPSPRDTVRERPENREKKRTKSEGRRRAA